MLRPLSISIYYTMGKLEYDEDDIVYNSTSAVPDGLSLIIPYMYSSLINPTYNLHF